MRLLYLLRHAQAAHGFPDDERPLTAEGLAQASAVGGLLRRLRGSASAVLSSPARRCRETAAALGIGSVRPDARLRLDGPLTGSLELCREAGAGAILVGHQPELLGLMAALLPEGATASVSLPPAALVGLSLQAGSARLALYVEPPQTRHLGPDAPAPACETGEP